MRIFRNLIIVVVCFYVAAWVAVVVYFNHANGREELLESSLSRIFHRPVTVGSVTTAWNGFSPRIYIENLQVMGDAQDRPALAFKSLAAELDFFSIFKFWPQFSEFAVEQPRLEVVSLSVDQLQVGGIRLRSNRSAGISQKRLISWMLNHQNLVWHDGEIAWRRLDGQIQRYTETSFVYRRKQQDRLIRATTLTRKGGLAFKARSRGEVLEADNWDAELEVIGSRGEPLLSPEDVSLEVSDGKGRLALKALNVERIRDLLRLSGLGSQLGWILQSQLTGSLHDVEFEFSGPLLELRQWALRANASDISFKAVFPAPAMNNLSGQLVATSAGGEFKFGAADAQFEWPRWFEQPFQISRTNGDLLWSLDADGNLTLTLQDAALQDADAALSELNAEIMIDTKARKVANLGQLFKVDSISDLSFEGGQVVLPEEAGIAGSRPLHLDATANFSISSLSKMDRYFPNLKRLSKLRTWWSNAVLAGDATAGRISYSGDVTATAIYQGRAQLDASFDYSGVELDYGYQRQWPKVLKGRGRAVLNNDLLDFQPQEVWLEQDQVLQPKLQISNLFKLDRRLDLSGSMNTSLNTVAEFLFNGPLGKKQQNKKPLAIKVEAGQVAADISVSIPLQRVSRTQVQGVAEVNGGRIVLPPSVPVDDINTTINFTERSASAKKITAGFLGHPTSARMITTRVAQPPILKLTATGTGEIAALKPWIGPYLLTWFNGSYPWQGSVVIDGPKVLVEADSNLLGVAVAAPPPLQKSADEEQRMSLAMQVGSQSVQQSLTLRLGEEFEAHFEGNLEQQNTLLDSGLISLGSGIPKPPESKIKPGIAFDVRRPRIDLDEWLSSIIDLARLEVEATGDTLLLDAMRSINIETGDANFLGGPFGPLKLSGVSVDGAYWIGALNGENVDGTLQAAPREQIPSYRFKLSHLRLPSHADEQAPDEPADRSLSPAVYPHFELQTDSFILGQKKLGRLQLSGQPSGDIWELNKFELTDAGISTTASGRWVNNANVGTISDFSYQTTIDAVGDVLEGMDFAGILRKGRGEMAGKLTWIGAPHEFDYARLNGDFDLRIRDGELIQIEPGGGKLLGLLNFNAIARRLTLDFSDLFSSGLQFDRIRFAGVLADGEAIMRDAYIFSPSVFVQMEGKLDLHNELIDMEMHLSPELGGNLTLLSTLANPAAGAVMFLTQQLFKDEMRASSFQSYRAFGSWDDFELQKIGSDDEVPDTESVSSEDTTQTTNDIAR